MADLFKNITCDNIENEHLCCAIAEKIQGATVGFPYSGAKEHYILDIDNSDFSCEIVRILEPVTPLPKPKKKK